MARGGGVGERGGEQKQKAMVCVREDAHLLLHSPWHLHKDGALDGDEHLTQSAGARHPARALPGPQQGEAHLAISILQRGEGEGERRGGGG